MALHLASRFKTEAWGNSLIRKIPGKMKRAGNEEYINFILIATAEWRIKCKGRVKKNSKNLRMWIGKLREHLGSLQWSLVVWWEQPRS